MASYFKYVERNADSFVDWGAIGKSMSDMLQQENRVREEKKAAIDEASRQFGETLANAPQGDHKGMNQWTLEYANNAQQARLLQDKLLKSGQLKLKDYLVQRQNLTDGTNQALGLVKEYQTEYSTKMERYKTEKSQYLEQWLMAQAEGFGNFNSTNLYINPTDGTVSVGKMVKNPKTGVMELSKDPNDFTTVNTLRNRIKSTFDKFDVPSTMESFVDGLGSEINTLYQAATTANAGRLTNVLDITQRKNLPKNLQGVVMTFEEAETKKLNSFLTNPLNVSSVLTNNVKFAPNGEEYTFTWNENEAKTKKNLILLKNNASGMPEPQFTEEQKNQALEHLRLEARLRYDKKVGVDVTGQLQQRTPRAATPPREKEGEANLFARNLSALLTSSDQTDLNNAGNYFRSIGASVKKSGDKLMINGLEYNLSGQSPDKVARSVISGLNKNLLPEDLIYKYTIPLLGGGLNLTAESTGPEPKPSETKFEIGPSVFKAKQDQAAPLLQSKLSSLGDFKVEATGWIRNNGVVTSPTGDKFPVNFNQGESGAQTQNDNLMIWVNGQREKMSRSEQQSKSKKNTATQAP